LIPKLLSSNTATSKSKEEKVKPIEKSNETSTKKVDTKSIVIDIQLCDEGSDIEVVGTKSSPITPESLPVTPIQSTIASTARKEEEVKSIKKKISIVNNDVNNNKKVKQSSLSQFIKIVGEPRVPRITETKYEPVKIPNPIKITWARTISPYFSPPEEVEGSRYRYLFIVSLNI
jgi:hypothetical protein